MLTVQEINEYVHGKPGMVEIKQFSRNEAWEIGIGLGIDWRKFDVEQFAMGLNIELKHGRRYAQTNVTNDDPVMTAKIVLAHLNAIPDYYTRLAVMERQAKWVKARNEPEDNNERSQLRADAGVAMLLKCEPLVPGYGAPARI